MNKNRMYPTYFIFGALLLYTVLYVLPSVMGIAYSFTDWSVYSQDVHFVGLKNFQTVFSADYNYNRMLGNTFLFTFVTTLAKNAIGLALAVLLTKRVKLLNFHRAVMYLPCVLSALIVGMIFKSVLNPKIGVFYIAAIPQFTPAGTNALLMGMGLSAVHVALTLVWAVALVYGVRIAGRWLGSAKSVSWMDRITGTVLIGFGLKVALSRP